MRICGSEEMASILVVDDDPDSRDVLSRSLLKAGYAVRSAENGRLALIALASAVPDVIVLDVRMPEMNGVEFLQVIRSYLRWSTVPVILLTAYGEGPHMERARELGVKHVFLKATYRLDELLACIGEVLRDPQAQCEEAG